MSGATVRCKFLLAAKPAPGGAVTKAVSSTKPSSPSRAARMLALAHHIERLVEAGELENYADAARSLGLTRARLTQVVKRLLLGPEVEQQGRVSKGGATERARRRAVGEAQG